MENFLLQLHSGVRWLVVIVTLAVLIKLILGLVRKSDYDQLTYRLMIAFSGLATVQWLIGIILFLVLSGSFSSGTRWEHALTMTIAVGVSHMHMRWRRAPGSIRYRTSLIIVVVALVLIFIGVARLPQGWRLSP